MEGCSGGAQALGWGPSARWRLPGVVGKHPSGRRSCLCYITRGAEHSCVTLALPTREMGAHSSFRALEDGSL